MRMLRLMIAAVATASVVTLGACGGQQAAPGGTGGDSGSDTIVLGFAQVGAESGWRTANTKSIQDAAKEAGDRPEVLRRPAEAGEPDQGDPLLHPAEGRRDRLLAGGRVRLGHGAQGGQDRQHPGGADRPGRRLDGRLALRHLPRQRLHRGGQEGRRLGGQGVRRRVRREDHPAGGHHRLGAGHRPGRGLRRRDQGRPEVQDRRLPDRRLHPGRRQAGHRGAAEVQPRRQPRSTPTTTTWVWARSRPSRRPARCPARTSRSSPWTRSRTA